MVRTFSEGISLKVNVTAWLDSCLFGWFVLLRINPFPVIERRIKFQTSQLNISMVFVYQQLKFKTVQLNVKAVLFQKFSLA